MKRQLSVADVISLTGIHFNGLMASQTPNDIRLLAENVKLLPSSGLYLEIGTRDGFSATTALLANLFIDVYSVDIDENCGDKALSYLDEIASLSRLGNYYAPDEWELKERFHFLPGDSVEVSKGWNKPIDFLFIDGDHSEEGCTRDANAWMPFLKCGAILGFHDYIFWEHEKMKVKTAVDKLMMATNAYYFLGASEQIALFRKKGE